MIATLLAPLLTFLLAVYLILIGPGLNLWRSLRPRAERPERTPMRRYWLMSRSMLVMLAILAIAMACSRHGLHDIGFDLPLSPAGAWGLLFAAVLMAGLVGAALVMEARQTPQARAESERKLLEAPFPWPTTALETLAFAASMSLMTAAWEILYRGFLLLVLTPHTGLALAVVISALAYGIGHGYQNPKQFVGSIVSAFAFTLGYAFTHSLWWLIAIHVAVPLSMLPGVFKARRRQRETSHLSVATLTVPGTALD